MNLPSGKTKAVGIFEPVFGTISCPECQMFWVEQYVPEYCPQCGIRVAEKAGEGQESLLSAMVRVGVPIDIIRCPQCGTSYSDHACPDRCFRCWYDLTGIKRGGGIRRVFLKIRRLFLIHGIR